MIEILGEKLHTSKEVCDMFKFKEATLRKFINAGAITPTKIPPRNYFSEPEVRRLLEHLKTRNG